MGCCLTTTAAAAAADDLKNHPKTRDTSPPLPPGSGEETVKEVLSETPVTSNKLPPTNSIPTLLTGANTRSFQSEEEFTSKDVVVQVTKNPVEENASEASSEMYTYSYSASLSAATTTTIGTGIEIDEDGEVTQKVNKPPPAKMVSRRQSRTCSVERARRKERGIRPPSASPARRSGLRSTDKNQQQFIPRPATTAQRSQNVVSSNAVGREPPVRRSRSPALRGEAGQRQKLKEKSPVKNSGKRLPVNVRENEVNVLSKRTTSVGVMPVPTPEPETEPETKESLDNPLVSLECFIFL